MRVEEHMYQGFFGLKKKQDAGKYYHERVEKLKGLDADLDEMIISFQQVIMDHKIKIDAYDKFLNAPSIESFRLVRQEIEKLEGMFDRDELANDTEERCCVKGTSILKELIGNEESVELGQLEKEASHDLVELHRMLVAIEPIWQRQIDMMQKSDKDIITSTQNIAELSKIFSEESALLKMEESIIRQIDLKTGSLLRKTSLKEEDIARTKEMDMSYREIRHVR